MTASVVRISQALDISARWALLMSVVGLAVLGAAVAVAARLGVLPLAVGALLIAFGGVICLRWPLLALAAFVALIPIEEVFLIDGVGTLSKFAGVAFAVTYGARRIGRLELGVMPPAAWAFLLWAIASLGWAIDPTTSWAELSTLLQLFIIAILIADLVVQQPTVVRPVLWIYSLSAAATAFVGVLTFIGFGPGADARAAAIQGQNPAQFAAVLLPALVFGTYEALERERRALGAAIALLTTAGIIVSGTRGAWLSIAVVVAIFVLPRLEFRRQVAAVGLMLVIGVATLQIPGVTQLLADRAGTAVTTGGSGRTDIWSVGATIYWAHPVFGVGYANFPVAYTSDVVAASNVTFGFAQGQGIGPHNVAIGTLIELGPIGLLTLTLFLLPLVLRRGWGPDAATVQAALASLLVLALFLDIVGNRKQVWLIIGLAAGLAYIKRKRRPERVDEEVGTPAMFAGPAHLPNGLVPIGSSDSPMPWVHPDRVRD